MSAQQGQGREDNAYNILWLIALVMIVGLVVWYSFKPQLQTAFVWLKFAEAWLIYQISYLVSLMELPWLDPEANFLPWMNEMRQLTHIPTAINGDMALAISTGLGDYLKYPCALILVIFGARFWLKSVPQRYKHRYDMRMLADSQSQLWPQTQVTRREDLVAADLDQGPWAMALTPAQFCRKHKLLDLSILPNNEAVLDKEERYKAQLVKERAERVLSAQLGRPWQGIQKMAPHRRAILGILFGRGCRDTAAAQKLIAQLARTASIGKISFEDCDALLEKHINHKLVQKICAQHGYELSLFASALEFAREDGVVASCEFLWVKPIDRSLWYVLNSIGRQTPHVEAAGVFNHWTTEKKLKRALSVPFVTQAVLALETALNEMIYRPDESELKMLHEGQAS